MTQSFSFHSLVLTLLFLAAHSLAAQPPPAPLFEAPLAGPGLGVYGGIHRASVDASFAVDSRGLTRQADCGRYESGSESGYVVGAMGELSLTHMFGLHVGAELALRDASLSYPCVDPAGTRMPDGSIAPAVTEFQSETSYSMLTLQFSGTFRPASFPFIVAVGPSVSVLTAAEYTAREVILTPDEASFLSGGQERQVGSGSFESGDISVALGGSIWYEARIAGRFWLVPRVSGAIALTDEIAGGGVRTSGLQATLGLLYRFPPRTTVASPIEAGTAPARQ